MFMGREGGNKGGKEGEKNKGKVNGAWYQVRQIRREKSKMVGNSGRYRV